MFISHLSQIIFLLLSLIIFGCMTTLVLALALASKKTSNLKYWDSHQFEMKKVPGRDNKKH